jgi:hypothetical protein
MGNVCAHCGEGPLLYPDYIKCRFCSMNVCESKCRNTCGLYFLGPELSSKRFEKQINIILSDEYLNHEDYDVEWLTENGFESPEQALLIDREDMLDKLLESAKKIFKNKFLDAKIGTHDEMDKIFQPIAREIEYNHYEYPDSITHDEIGDLPDKLWEARLEFWYHSGQFVSHQGSYDHDLEGPFVWEKKMIELLDIANHFCIVLKNLVNEGNPVIKKYFKNKQIDELIKDEEWENYDCE